LAWRFRRTIHVVDATVIQLVASCLDWAEHNHRKAAAKCHLRLSLRSLLPGFVVVGSAHESELSRVRALCAGLRRGEIVLFDRGYHDLAHFWELTERGVFFVTRPLPAVGFKVVQRLPRSPDMRVLSDELVVTTGRQAAGDYPKPLRRVTARVLIDGEERVMEFLTNNLTWSASSVAELYRCRWQIEAFFKQVKQTLQLADFLGHNANAVKWQIWIALLVYVLLRFQAWCSQWAHSFSRLFTLLRATLWQRRDLAQWLRRYGTGQGHYVWLNGHAQSWLPGFAQ
ncbi:MAG: IS4 family transposase, partial [Opitutaceae bacterium]|nr:IS4 family transposase [Opitutaceae bacterium]